MTQPSLPARELWRTLRLTLPDLWRAQPLVTAGLFLSGAAQGALPAVTILIGKWTVDGVSGLLAGQSVNLTVLAAAWVGAALLTQVTVTLTQVMQGVAADHYTLHVNQRLMRRMTELYGLRLNGLQSPFNPSGCEWERNGFRTWSRQSGEVPDCWRNKRNPYYRVWTCWKTRSSTTTSRCFRAARVTGR